MKRYAGRTGLIFAVLLCAALSMQNGVRAQDPAATIAQKAARDWLALTDRGDASASWNAAGKLFQNAITVERWAEGFKKVRSPLGPVAERTMLSTQFTKSFQGAPDGDYALLVFRTNFANKTDGRETVTLQREADGNWRVVGYFIR
jgi:Protein of unknown function (DUF4019)